MIPLENRKILSRFILTGLVVTLYDVLLHSLFIAIHIGFEWFEFALEEIIEHVFHTTRHQSQIIVFYLLCFIGLTLLYCLWRALPGLYNRLKARLLAAGSQCKLDIAHYWEEQSSIRKVKWVTSITLSLSFLAILVLS